MNSRTVPIEERIALHDALVAYCTGVDSLTDLDGLVDCFSDDAVLDLSGLKLPIFKGREQIRGFYEQVFRDMSHHMHMMTNFRVAEFTGQTAKCLAYIAGMGRSHKGLDVLVYVYYDIDYRKTAAGWKISRFYEAPKLPMPDSVTAIHSR